MPQDVKSATNVATESIQPATKRKKNGRVFFSLLFLFTICHRQRHLASSRNRQGNARSSGNKTPQNAGTGRIISRHPRQRHRGLDLRRSLPRTNRSRRRATYFTSSSTTRPSGIRRQSVRCLGPLLCYSLSQLETPRGLQDCALLATSNATMGLYS